MVALISPLCVKQVQKIYMFKQKFWLQVERTTAITLLWTDRSERLFTLAWEKSIVLMTFQLSKLLKELTPYLSFNEKMESQCDELQSSRVVVHLHLNSQTTDVDDSWREIPQLIQALASKVLESSNPKIKHSKV